MKHGKFIISLDLELLWGVRDKRTIDSYGENIRGVHEIVPKLLNTFKAYDIKATFSIVGFLFFETKQALLNHLPELKPSYRNPQLSPYNGHFKLVGDNYQNDIYHFAPKLIKEIQKYPEQEIGTHTYCHYYCLEEGQTPMEFKADLESAIAIANDHDIKLQSLIFPRNQFNQTYLKICEDLGIICYRGNENSWLYQAKDNEHQSKFKRAIRLLDTYINISGHNCYSDECLKGKMPIDIPSSRLLRPYSKTLKHFDSLRLNRIKSGMTYAARNNQTFHLWWHPHNFGVNQLENMKFLSKILNHYQKLNLKYGFQSYNMTELANAIISEYER